MVEVSIQDVPTEPDVREERKSKTTADILLGPFILPADLILFLGGEIILNVESLADLLRRFTLDHVGDRLAPNVKQSFDIEVVRSLQAVSLRT